MKREFRIKSPDSHCVINANQDYPFIGAILEHSPNGNYWIRYNLSKIEALTKDGEYALEMLQQVLQEQTGASHVLQTGDFLVFDNYRILHRRPSFMRNCVHEKARWLRRVYAFKM